MTEIMRRLRDQLCAMQQRTDDARRPGADPLIPIVLLELIDLDHSVEALKATVAALRTDVDRLFTLIPPPAPSEEIPDAVGVALRAVLGRLQAIR